MATDSYGSSPISPNKRRKTLSATSKSKIIDDANHNQQESQEQQQWTANSPCMICLSDCGKSIRGEIDCCDHYFCFICVMEWAKIESRCPACKRRFSTIRRPFKDGVFAPERVVRVPLRDQVRATSVLINVFLTWVLSFVNWVVFNFVLGLICEMLLE